MKSSIDIITTLYYSFGTVTTTTPDAFPLSTPYKTVLRDGVEKTEMKREVVSERIYHIYT
jgi:hypothetical protein